MTDAPSTPAGVPAGAPSAGATGSSFFDWIRGFGLRRSDDRWLAGVAGGIAEHTRLDPLIIRGAILVVALLGGPALFLYAVAWALLPDREGRIYLERALRGMFEPAMVAIGVLIALTFVPFMQGIWWRGAPDWWSMPEWLESTLRTGWVLVLAAALIWLAVVVARRMPRGTTAGTGARSHADFWATPGAPGTAGAAAATFTAAGSSATDAAAATGQGWPPSAPGAPSQIWYATPAAAYSGSAGPTAAEREAQRLQREAARAQQRREHEERYRLRQPGAAFVSIALGLAVVAGTLTPLLLGYHAWSDVAVVIGIGTALAVLALATIIAGIRGKESGALGFFAVVAILALLFVGVFPRGTAVSAFGNTVWTVSDVGERSDDGYAMLAGSPTLDLSRLDDRGADTGGTVDLWLGAGGLDVILPEDAPVTVEVNGFVSGLTFFDESGDADNGRGGLFFTDVVRFGADSSDTTDTTTVRIWIGAGGVNLLDTLRSER